MTDTEFRDILSKLGVTQAELARLLGVTDRTVRRWVDAPTDMPGPAVQALRAWRRLNDLHLSWRPDGLMLGNEDKLAKLIAHYRHQPLNLTDVAHRVAARGGANTPWVVDLSAGTARLGLMTVEFTETPGGFAPVAYRRSDGRTPDLQRDRDLIDDAYMCIDAALKKRSV